MVDCKIKGDNCHKITVDKLSVKKTSFVDVSFNFIK